MGLATGAVYRCFGGKEQVPIAICELPGLIAICELPGLRPGA
jgi:hypothetical protein